MPAAIDVVRLHPSITQDPAQIAPGRRQGSRRPAMRAQSLQVDPEVWRTALQLADGDALRIDVESAERVVVRVRNRV